MLHFFYRLGRVSYALWRDPRGEQEATHQLGPWTFQAIEPGYAYRWIVDDNRTLVWGIGPTIHAALADYARSLWALWRIRRRKHRPWTPPAK